MDEESEGGAGREGGKEEEDVASGCSSFPISLFKRSVQSKKLKQPKRFFIMCFLPLHV